MDSASKILVGILLELQATWSVAAKDTRNWTIVFSKALRKGSESLLSVVPGRVLKRLNLTAPLSWAILHSLAAVMLVSASVCSLLTSVVNTNLCVCILLEFHIF